MAPGEGPDRLHRHPPGSSSAPVNPQRTDAGLDLQRDPVGELLDPLCCPGLPATEPRKAPGSGSLRSAWQPVWLVGRAVPGGAALPCPIPGAYRSVIVLAPTASPRLREMSRMAGGLIKVTPEQLASVAGQLSGGAGSIEGTLGQLAGNVSPLGSDWAGVAQARFLQLWEQWQTSSKQLHQALVEISALMNRAGGAYEQNEQSVASSFSR